MNNEQLAIEKACQELAAEQPRRAVPSPSSNPDCRRQVWFNGTGMAPTEKWDAESYLSAETGGASEPTLSAIVEKAGFGNLIFVTEAARELSKPQLARISMRGGQVDNIMQLNPPWSTRYGPQAVVEFKRKGVYGYLDLLRKGVIEGAPGDWEQAQAYMHAWDLPVCFYLAANYDRSALTANTRKWVPRPFGYFVEWIERSPAALGPIKARAEMHQANIDNIKEAALVPRDYNPEGSKVDWQCNWCSWKTACVEAGVR